jgi:hypothetical protein
MPRPPKAPPTPEDRQAALRLDYQLTVESIKLFADLRFRCLAFVTALIALTAAIANKDTPPGLAAGLGAIGLATTLGIVIYDLRNSQLYDAAIHRAKAIEAALGLIRAGELEDGGGLYSERPRFFDDQSWIAHVVEQRRRREQGIDLLPDTPPLMTLWQVPIKHDRGLALIYAGVLGGWVFLVCFGLMSIPAPKPEVGLLPRTITAWSLLAGLLTGLAVALRLGDLDRLRYKPKHMGWEPHKAPDASAPAAGP